MPRVLNEVRFGVKPFQTDSVRVLRRNVVTMKVVLELLDQDANVRRITVRHDIVIGRNSECNLRLSSPQVSRRHCFLRVGRDDVSVTDLDSSNGTFIDGNRIATGKWYPIVNGATLAIGPVRFSVRISRELPSSDPGSPSDSLAPLDDAVSGVSAVRAHGGSTVTSHAVLTETRKPILSSGSGKTAFIPSVLSSGSAAPPTGTDEPTEMMFSDNGIDDTGGVDATILQENSESDDPLAPGSR
jgi:pSer/pThr/pTyr-binding forkhead associated (FHA) protein